MLRPPLPVLGWKEQVALPDLGIPRLRAKLDTGARTSALHVEDLEVAGQVEVDGQSVDLLRFTVLSGARRQPVRHTIEVPAVDRRVVRDTGANEEDRHVIRTRISCGPLDVMADVTLTSRTGMNFRMLIGRTTMEHACLVDPSRGYLWTPEPPPVRADAGPASAESPDRSQDG